MGYPGNQPVSAVPDFRYTGHMGIPTVNSATGSVLFQRFRGLFIRGLRLLTTLTITYAFVTANDPLVELFEDVIVYTHLTIGLAFVAMY